MSSIAARTREFLTRRAPELRQTLRVTIATGAAYVAYKSLGLQQGYWAVFTVIIVMQGSIGGTLGAATERACHRRHRVGRCGSSPIAGRAGHGGDHAADGACGRTGGAVRSGQNY